MFIAIENLLPHRAPMQWINALTGCTEKTAGATACFKENDFAVVDGLVLETALVECVSQAVGAAFGHRGGGKSGGADKGMLVAVSNFKIASAFFVAVAASAPVNVNSLAMYLTYSARIFTLALSVLK